MKASDLGVIAQILTSWVRVHAACETVEIVSVGDAHAPTMASGTVLERAASGGGTCILVAAPGSPTGWFAFTTALEPGRGTDSIRRLLLLAAALGGARLMQIASRLTIKEENEAPRR